MATVLEVLEQAIMTQNSQPEQNTSYCARFTVGEETWKIRVFFDTEATEEFTVYLKRRN